jgi:16S rRNA (uracil1498-N3)-methyltransferase
MNWSGAPRSTPENTVQDRVSRHRIHIPSISTTGEIAISGPEAHHALRVKRLRPADEVELLDGQGSVASATVRTFEKRGREYTLVCAVREVRHVGPPRPALHVLAGMPKGPHLAEMISGLSQAGATSWSPLVSARTVVEPREGRLERMRAVAIESLKQCGRPWLMEVHPPVVFSEAVMRNPLIVAHADAPRYVHRTCDELTLMIGPEGGWTEEELGTLRAVGATLASFGAYTMRTETAAVVCAGIVLHLAAAGGSDTLVA